MHLKRFLVSAMLLILSVPAGADETIKAENNAYIHNNKGLRYLKEDYYFGAIKEFEIAIDLLPESQASATYYVNLGTTYEKIGYPSLARKHFEKAVSLSPLCFEYYVKLCANYKKLGIVDEQISAFKNNPQSPLNDIVIGLLYIERGDVQTGITVLDDFCDKEPNLLITDGVKGYLKKITKEKL